MRAIHDRYYASPPGSFTDYRWRLQLLAEERLGTATREAQAEEDSAFARAGKVLA